MTDVLRLSPDLAIVPSMVQSVAVHAVRLPRRSNDGRVEFYTVVVVYLFGHEQIVASFHPGPNATLEMVDGVQYWVPVPGYDYDDEIVACEARAHVVYEAILQAVKGVA